MTNDKEKELTRVKVVYQYQSKDLQIASSIAQLDEPSLEAIFQSGEFEFTTTTKVVKKSIKKLIKEIESRAKKAGEVLKIIDFFILEKIDD